MPHEAPSGTALTDPATAAPAAILEPIDPTDRIRGIITDLRWLPRTIPWCAYRLAQLSADELERAVSPDGYDRPTEHFTNRYLRDLKAMQQGRLPS